MWGGGHQAEAMGAENLTNGGKTRSQKGDYCLKALPAPLALMAKAGLDRKSGLDTSLNAAAAGLYCRLGKAIAQAESELHWGHGRDSDTLLHL